MNNFTPSNQKKAFSSKYELYWKTFKFYITKLAENISEYEKAQNYEFVRITGVPRGGLVGAVMLSNILDTPFIEFKDYVADENKPTIVFDDIVDTGKTINDILLSRQDVFVSIFCKRNAKNRPTFYNKIILDNTWVVFPWETKYEQRQYEQRPRPRRYQNNFDRNRRRYQPRRFERYSRQNYQNVSI